MRSERANATVMVERRAIIMATDVAAHIACSPERAAEADTAIERAFAWLCEVDRRLTRFDAASELCKLNASPGEWFDASEILFDAVDQSVRAAEASGGLFDPSILPLLEHLGYDRDYKQLDRGQEEHAQPAPECPASIWREGGWRRVELDHRARRIRLAKGVRLDLGGIAKGWAADITVERYFAAFPDVLVEMSGDMRVRGHGADGQPWGVGVANPRANAACGEAHLAVVSLASGGVACSGANSTWWRHRGERQHHLLDPRTGKPAPLWVNADDDGPEALTLIATATAFASTASHAEVAAKVALLRGYPDALRAVEAAWEAAPEPAPYRDAGVALLLVMGDGRIVCSENLRDWLATCGGGGDVWLD